MQPEKVLPLCMRQGQAAEAGPWSPLFASHPPSAQAASTVPAGLGLKAMS